MSLKPYPKAQKSQKLKELCAKTKRGDTFIEVMFAIAIFSLVAVLSISMMNAGVADAERALELVTARNELNAQAEALRFIHSSYISEATLPTCGSVASDEKCQQYQALWDEITSSAHVMRPSDDVTGLNDNYTITDLYETCREIYTSPDPTTAYQDLLARNRAFVINTRELIAPRNTGIGLGEAYISSLSPTDRDLFTPALLNARIIFTRTGQRGSADTDSSTVNISDTANPLDYKSVARAEGLWVVAVRSSEMTAGQPTFYDFHINSCWYGSNSNVPTALDAVIRLYNPESIR